MTDAPEDLAGQAAGAANVRNPPRVADLATFQAVALSSADTPNDKRRIGR